MNLRRQLFARVEPLIFAGHDRLLIPASPADADPAHPGHVIRGGLAGWQKRRVVAHIERYLETSLLTDDLAAIARLSRKRRGGQFERLVRVTTG